MTQVALYLVKHFHPKYSLCHIGLNSHILSCFLTKNAQITMFCGTSGKHFATWSSNRSQPFSNSSWSSPTSIIKQWTGWPSAQFPNSSGPRPNLCPAASSYAITSNSTWTHLLTKCLLFCTKNSLLTSMPETHPCRSSEWTSRARREVRRRTTPCCNFRKQLSQW